MTEPLVTTIIPTYNRADLVCEALDSVRRQTYRNVEVIVVDDGSTDDTRARLKAYGGSIRVIAQENSGPSAARNRGIEAARGDIVAFLDSDDAWHPTKVERQVRVLQRAGAAVPCCLCNATVSRPDGRAVTSFQYAGLAPSYAEGLWENVTEVLVTRFVMFTQMVAVRRSVLERIGGFDERLWLMEDYDLALRLSLEGPWAYISDPLVTYRQDSAGSLAAAGHANDIRLVEDSIQARQNLYERIAASERHRHLRRASRRAVEAFRRERRGIELSHRSSRLHAALGRSVLQLNRWRRALHRRSPWYPDMRVAALSVPGMMQERQF